MNVSESGVCVGGGCECMLVRPFFPMCTVPQDTVERLERALRVVKQGRSDH